MKLDAMHRRAQVERMPTRTGDEASSPGVSQLLELIRILSSSESDKKQSLESRATTVISSSGGLVTLLLAFATWQSQQGHLNVPADAKYFLVTGLSLLLLATIAGIAVGAPSNMKAIEATSLLDGLKDGSWDTGEAHAQRVIALAQLLVLISRSTQNRKKAYMLLAGVSAQALGVAFIAVAVITILY